MIIPFAHEDLRARRWPFVTIALIVLNVVALVMQTMATDAQEERVVAAAEQAVRYFEAHPYLQQCEPVEQLHVVRPSRRRAWQTLLVPADTEDEQAEYGALCHHVELALAELPARQFGYVPRENGLLALFTYQFLHAGWIHLLSNMWFLWLCGCNLEDRWGRPVFTAFYLTAGVAAALAQKLAAPDSMTAVIGASGAIAGAMGAFLVVFARTRIRFAYVLFIRFGTFDAPAYVMLPMWLFTEIFWGVIGGGNVAHWVHVGGFLFGAAFALMLRASGIEQRLDRAVDKTVTTEQDPRIVQAGDLINAGSPEEAMAILLPLSARQPRSIDAQLELLRAAKGAKNREREVAAYARLIDLYFDTGAPDTAVDLFAEMYALGLHEALTRASTWRVAEQLASRASFDRADAAYTAACREGLVDVAAVRATMAHASVLLRLGRRDHARALFTAARESPFSSAEIDAVIDAELARLDPSL